MIKCIYIHTMTQIDTFKINVMVSVLTQFELKDAKIIK